MYAVYNLLPINITRVVIKLVYMYMTVDLIVQFIYCESNLMYYRNNNYNFTPLISRVYLMWILRSNIFLSLNDSWINV